jgi:6-phosphogluconolactonase
VANSGSNNISAYHIAPTGALTPVPGSFLAGSQPRCVAVNSLGRSVYVTNLLSNNVSAYRIGPNGALTPVPGSPYPTLLGSSPNSVAVDFLGRFAYVVTNDPFGNLLAYQIGASGALTPVPGLFNAGFQPRSVAVDLLGLFVYVGHEVRAFLPPPYHTIRAYSIGPNGALTPVPGSPFQAGTNPGSVAVGP